jgi:CysZ protein
MKLVKGIGYLLNGAKILTHPDLRLFVLLPLLVNIIMFAIGLGVLIFFIGGWMEDVVSWLPLWMSGISFILWLLFVIFFGMAVFFSFNLIANFIAAPLNGLLAEKVQQHLTGQPLGDTNLGSLVSSIPRSIVREVTKLTYYLPRILLLLVLTIVPVINIIVPWLWLFFGAWIMVIQYVDYPMDNNGVSFKTMKRSLSQQRMLHLGFGGAVSMLLLIPVINFFTMPIAVAGATALYVNEHLASDENVDRQK